jgi:chorismate mutase
MDLKDYRNEIDEIDSQLLELLEKRFRAAEGAARCKKAAGRPIYDPVREKEHIDGIASAADSELREYDIRIFREIMAACRDRENEMPGIRE